MAELQTGVDRDMACDAVVENAEGTEGVENTLWTCFVTWTRYSCPVSDDLQSEMQNVNRIWPADVCEEWTSFGISIFPHRRC